MSRCLSRTSGVCRQKLRMTFLPGYAVSKHFKRDSPNAIHHGSLFGWAKKLITDDRPPILTVSDTKSAHLELVRIGGALFNVLNRHYWGGLQTDLDTPESVGRFTTVSGPPTGRLWMEAEF